MNRPEPQYRFAPEMSQTARFGLSAFFCLFGFALQVWASCVPGFLFMLVASLFLLPKAVKVEPKIKGTSEWTPVTMVEFEKITTQLKQNREFKEKRSGFGPGGAKGCGSCFASIASVVFAAILVYSVLDSNNSQGLAPVIQGGSIGLIFAFDAFMMLFPIWIAGSINIWNPPNMETRMAQLTYIYTSFAGNQSIEFIPNLLLEKNEDKSVPLDCKLMVKFKSSNESFMGIQVQTSLNDVQSVKYPYTYCVLIAKPEFNLINKAQSIVQMPPRGGFPTNIFSDTNAKKESKFARYYQSLVELKSEGDVEIAVVRQPTSGTGYRTDPDQASSLFSAAYNLAIEVLKL